jgi:hypothetical protein
MTQGLATFFEAGIREHPYDWLMLQRVFVDDLDSERLAAADERARQDGQVNGEELAGQEVP